MKTNMNKCNRTDIYGLPMHASALPGHTFQISFIGGLGMEAHGVLLFTAELLTIDRFYETEASLYLLVFPLLSLPGFSGKDQTHGHTNKLVKLSAL